MQRFRILTISSAIPRPDWNSGDRRYFGMLQLLAKYHNIDLWTASRDRKSVKEKGYEKQIADIGVRILDSENGIEAVLAKIHYDVVLIEFYWLAEQFISTVRRYQPQAKIIVDSVDLHFAREQFAASLGIVKSQQAEETKRKELSIYQHADAVIVVSDLDYQLLHAEDDALRISIVSNIVPSIERTANPDSTELIFVGGFNWFPNVDGIKWFVHNVWPLVQERVSDATVTVIGSNPTEEIFELGKVSGICVMGYVSDTVPYLKRAAVSIAPLRYGGGMKGKVNEAMSLALPVVTTTAGAQGLNAVSGEHLLIADDPVEFAESIISLLKDPSRCIAIGLAGQQHNAMLCSPKVAEQALHEMLTSLEISSFRILSLVWLRYKIYFHMLSVLKSTFLWQPAIALRNKLKQLAKFSKRGLQV